VAARRAGATTVAQADDAGPTRSRIGDSFCQTARDLPRLVLALALDLSWGMTQAPDSNAIIAVHGWRAGYDETHNVISVEFIDAEGSAHSFALSPETALSLADGLRLKTHALKYKRGGGKTMKAKH